MATSIVDGTVEEAITGRSRGGVTLFKSIRFKLDDGSSRTIIKSAVKQNVAEEITPGAKGRFYLYNAFDLKGVHGVRTPDGRAIYGFPGNNRKLFLILGVINVLWVGFKVAVDGEVPLLGAAVFILAVVGWILMGKGERDAQQQFEGDAGYGGAGGV